MPLPRITAKMTNLPVPWYHQFANMDVLDARDCGDSVDESTDVQLAGRSAAALYFVSCVVRQIICAR
ncbi:hypothetical protein KIN20_021443 [Parelaphostrongylus tenuis]|uniref:Uncharacterized protein n=1 Tax=Parelaphostrongylus tenuis TaxID=148309 RepID=A0AAD5MSS1_PARTN|nr:hypothetical protein KIN20_021443 [Parelaphostrongylus tenuis]